MLTAKTIDGLKPTAHRQCIADGTVEGLELIVHPTGRRVWTVRYRIGRRQRRMTLGQYPRVSLADVRKLAKEALRKVDHGDDPAEAKRTRLTAPTMHDLAEKFLTWAEEHKRSAAHDRRRLHKHILPRWRHRRVSEVTRADVRELVEQLAVKTPIEANRTLSLLTKLMNFAVDDGTLVVSPLSRMRKPANEQSRDRVLTEDELRAFWRDLDQLPDPAMAAFYKLRLLTAQRGQEVNAMRWQDLDFNERLWTIPADVAKNGLAHRVPLSPAVVTLLQRLQPASDAKRHPIYVLDGARGKRQQSEAAVTFTLENFRAHDLRRTAATLMTSGGVPRLIVSKVLNHAEKGVTAVYDRASYDTEKRAALNWWAQRVHDILAKKRSKVVPFVRQSA